MESCIGDDAQCQSGIAAAVAADSSENVGHLRIVAPDSSGCGYSYRGIGNQYASELGRSLDPAACRKPLRMQSGILVASIWVDHTAAAMLGELLHVARRELLERLRPHRFTHA
jgi:hypothetical protein